MSRIITISVTKCTQCPFCNTHQGYGGLEQQCLKTNRQIFCEDDGIHIGTQDGDPIPSFCPFDKTPDDSERFYHNDGHGDDDDGCS